MNKFARFVSTKRAVALAVASAVAGSASAAVPDEVTTAITTAGADLVTAGTAVIAALAAFWGIRKMGQKLGMW